MSHDPIHPDLSGALQRLDGYVTVLVERATARALRLFADVVTLEHVIGAAMEDEASAASQAVEHAFADPETLSQELLALSPGIMVVGSGAALAFSTLALRGLEGARAEAAERGSDGVTAAVVLAHAVRSLPGDAREGLAAAGFDDAGLAALPGSGGVVSDGPLFKHFAGPAKQALSLANKAASRAGDPSIGPAQIAAACLAAEPALEAHAGLSAAKARAVLAGRTRDETPPPERQLPADPELVAFLGRLPDGGGTLELLLACHGEGPDEVKELLNRHKVTPALLERSRGAFEDPAGGQSEETGLPPRTLD